MQRLKNGMASIKRGAIKAGNSIQRGTEKAIHTADIFNADIYLNMKGNKKMTSSLGTVLSVGLIIFILAQGAMKAHSMYKRQGAAISQVKELEPDPDFVYFNSSNNFMYAVSVTRYGVPVDMTAGSPFGFTMFYTQVFKDAQGNKLKTKNPVLMAPCNASNFPSSVYGEDVYTKYSLKYAYCPVSINYMVSGVCPTRIVGTYPTCVSPPNFALKGIYISNDFEYLQLNLWPCASKYLFYNMKCANGSLPKLYYNADYKVTLYYANTVISSQQHIAPNTTYLESIYAVINPLMSKLVDIYVDRVTIQDYDSLYFGSGYTNTTFYSIQPSNINENNLRQTSVASQFVQFNFRRSSVNLVTTRIYESVMDILTDLGGFSQAVMFAAAFLAMGYVEYKYHMILSNELFDFQMPNKEQEEMRKKRAKEKEKKPRKSMLKYLQMAKNNSDTIDKKELALNESVGQETTPKSLEMSRTESIRKEVGVEEYFEEMKIKRSMINFNLGAYAKSVGRWLTCRKGAEDEFAEKARDLAEEELNVVRIINKLKEIDKFKVVTMNRYQRELFNFIERPVIKRSRPEPVFLDNILPDLSFEHEEETEEGHQPEQEKLYARGEYASLSKYPKLYLAYRYLVEHKDGDYANRSQKVLDLIGEDLLQVFRKVDNIMDADPDPRNYEMKIQEIFEKIEAGESIVKKPE